MFAKKTPGGRKASHGVLCWPPSILSPDFRMPKLGRGDKDRKRCGARLRSRLGCCRNWPEDGKKRCRFHGGLSTGPKTEEGKAVVVAAMVEGRRRWVERMKAEGRKFPGGPKPESKRDVEAARIRAELIRLRRGVEARERSEPPPQIKRRPGRPSKAEIMTRAGYGDMAAVIEAADKAIASLKGSARTSGPTAD